MVIHLELGKVIYILIVENEDKNEHNYFSAKVLINVKVSPWELTSSLIITVLVFLQKVIQSSKEARKKVSQFSKNTFVAVKLGSVISV